MRTLTNQRPALSNLQEEEIRARFERSLDFFRKRSPVVFLSQWYRFWEPAGFVQQSLARFLTENGIEVLWLDGAGWRSYEPTVKNPNDLLQVQQWRQLPLRRFSLVEKADLEFQWMQLRRVLGKGKKPLLWVQGGIDERLAARFPYIDVFSLFDDPYCHRPTDELAEKARVILTQNSFSKKLFASHADKTLHALPPVDMRLEELPLLAPIELPKGASQKVMGYVGAFHSEGYDLVMFENFVTSFPDWTFLLAGRTDENGERWVERLKQYKNFVHFPWRSREEISALWRRLDVNLMLYRPAKVNDGAFPTKMLESLYFGVPMLATSVPKTSDLEGVCTRSSFPDVLKAKVESAAGTPAESLFAQYSQFAFEMDPRLHLARVAETLKD